MHMIPCNCSLVLDCQQVVINKQVTLLLNIPTAQVQKHCNTSAFVTGTSSKSTIGCGVYFIHVLIK